jgi:hypothetical protein
MPVAKCSLVRDIEEGSEMTPEQKYREFLENQINPPPMEPLKVHRPVVAKPQPVVRPADAVAPVLRLIKDVANGTN